MRARPGDLAYVYAYSLDRRHQPPEHLKGYPIISLLTPNPFGRFLSVAFEQSWNIFKNLDENLGDAFKKFSKTLPAVTWVCLSDASSFLENPNARDIGFFRNHKVGHVINKFQAPGRYQYPTGFVMASNFSYSITAAEDSLLSMGGRYRFFPYHDGPF